MATDFERNAYKATTGAGGAAMRRMQELAQALYDSTPGLQEDIPRHTSKILANVKKEDNRAEKRAQTFLGDGSTGNHTNLRKGGTIEKKDLTIAMTAEDWETKYKEIWEKYKEEKNKTKDLKEKMVKKQERYIGREHEYRHTIEQIEKQIEDNSTKPLEIIQEHDENQLLLQGLDPSHPDQQELMDKERRQKLKNELHINQKNVRQIHQLYDKLNETVSLVQDQTAKELWKQRSEIWSTLDKKLEDIKMQLKAETEKKKEDQYDFKEKEKELNEHLETMTQIAQKIDDENRSLMKKNSELKIQYLSQENDRDLLLKQLIYQKKENQRLRKVMEETKKRAEDLNGQTFTDPLQDKTLNVDNSRTQLPPKVGGNPYAQKFMEGRQSQNNLSGLNNSRRNISLSAANMFTGAGRPKTAAMGGGGLPRPPTAYTQGYGFQGKKTNLTTTNAQALGHRAISANILNNPRIKRYEDLIMRLKKMLQMEKKSLRMVRTMCSKEIEIKNNLEKVLRQCVEDVKAEIAKKRSENKSIYYAKGRKGQGELLDEKNLTQQEREKIIEVLLSQERVLTLLYDKTFPPRPATAKIGLKNAFGGRGGTAGSNMMEDNMRNFNYYGQINPDLEGVEEEDVEKLEKEIEEVLKNRVDGGDSSIGGMKYNQGIINISNKDPRAYSASTQVNGAGRRNLMSAAYRKNQNQQNDFTGQDIGDDIYEDEESSGDDGMN